MFKLDMTSKLNFMCTQLSFELESIHNELCRQYTFFLSKLESSQWRGLEVQI